MKRNRKRGTGGYGNSFLPRQTCVNPTAFDIIWHLLLIATDKTVSECAMLVDESIDPTRLILLSNGG